MDASQYLDVFIDESTEHLDVLYKQLLELEKNPTEKEVIEEIFRAAHTLKGMSATMGYNDLTDLTHNLENVFDKIRYDKISVQSDMVDVLFVAVDHLNAMVEDISNGGEGKGDVEQTILLLKAIEDGTIDTSIDKINKENNASEKGELQTIKKLDEFELTILNESVERNYHNYEITVRLREDCLLKGARVFMVFEVLEQLGEVIKSEPTVSDLEEENFDLSFTVIFVSKQSEQEIKEKINKVSEIEEVIVSHFSVSTFKEKQQQQADQQAKVKKKEPSNNNQRVTRKTIRVNLDRLDILMNLFEELAIDRGRLEQISTELNHPDLDETVERMSRVSGDLQNIILTMRMVPIDQVFNRFPSMVRQLARELEKDIALEIVGADTEIDRTVIDEIGDPLVHLIRNAVDHGLEMPEERRVKGKREQGTIKLHAYHSGNHVFIDITDDGAGINKEVILDKAIENGVIKEGESETLTDQQIYELILESGFSTTETVSDVSGRGVGLDVVKTTIETLGGNISIESEINKGSTFSIQLPLTLSIVSVLLVELGKETYAIPLSSIIETAIIHKDTIFDVLNKRVIDFRGKVVPITDLKDVFSVPKTHEVESDYISVVIVRRGDKMTGLVVDSFIGQQEVVLKSLGNYLQYTAAISGATILGDGEVALIVDSNALIK